MDRYQILQYEELRYILLLCHAQRNRFQHNLFFLIIYIPVGETILPYVTLNYKMFLKRIQFVLDQ